MTDREARRRRPLLLLIAGALGLRLMFLLAYGLDAPFVAWGDDHEYDRIARGLLAEGRLVSTWYPPGYSLLVAAVYGLSGFSVAAVRLLQAVLGAVTCGLVYLIGRRLAGERAALLGGALLAIYPGHVYFTWRLMAEILFAFLVALTVYLAQRLARAPGVARAASTGLALGAATIVKSNLMPMPPLLLGWIAWRLDARRLASLASAALAFLAVASVTPIASSLASGGGIAVTAGNAGHTLWWSNNPAADGYFVDPSGSPQADAFLTRHGLAERLASADPLARDAIYREAALRWIAAHPGAFLRLGVRKLDNAFGPWPRSALLEGSPRKRWLHLLSYGACLPFILVGVLLSVSRWRDYTVVYIPILSYAGMVVVFYGTPRFTLAVAPLLMLLAGSGLLAVVRRLTAGGGRAGGEAP